ncbi:Pc22g11570 [Penicillium rubens Wisconsin 54-1255]|uniref:Pc22g11570 protein n=1 Tax=Penicillium rubens (strain ATCC 28089 / DSM 1075 / NRRL 1951 / Wisconsin 54-1255) TaxID=500485 RepID=B6HQL3_PENRW|nr:Pc22g11570 [Penicillium rubens Wisconsin 54-1255]
MSSNAGQNPPPSKAVNIPNTASSTPFHSAAPAENSSQRRAGGSASFRPVVSSKTSATPRNNQARKSQHNRQRKPRLLDDDEYNESAAMKSTTSRKGQTSITHLMNFSLPPRPQYHPPPRSIRRYTSWGAGAVDKSRYVHANYRFIVMPNQSFHAQAANADVHLDWASVLQVLVSAQTQAASCPICLSTPVAPRMARCGHIFCLPCLIRYMHSSDDDNTVPEKRHRWKKCPICWDSVYISETRPVRWFRGQEGDLPVEGGDVVLRLVKREPGSTLALPRDGSETLGPDEDVPWYDVAEVADYARIMKGGEEYMTAQHDAEIEDLRKQEVEDELLFGDENTWTRKAIGSIMDAKEKLKGIGNPPEHTTVTPATSDEADHLSNSLDGVHLEPGSSVKAKEKGRSKQTPVSSGPDQPYHFYQALPQFYLSSLDIRILKAAFGEYSLFPATILPRVEHISTGHIVDDELRKRVKYLGHLPQGCEVSFLECDWRDVVVPEVLARFRAETDRRRKRNREKEAREEKDRIRAEKEEDDKRWAAARRKRPSIGSASVSEAPFSAHDFQPLPHNADPTLYDATASSASPPRSSAGFGALASPSTSPPGSRTVWGTAAVGSLSPSLEAQGAIHSDGWRQGWEDELFAQQESDLLAQTASGDQNANPGPSSSAGKKKKKNKTKITLMATSSQRGA